MPRQNNLVHELNDTCFGFAAESLTELCRLFEEELGEKPSLQNLCDILTLGIKACSADVLKDINVESLLSLTPKVSPHKKVRIKPGDIFAIPRLAGGFYLVVYIVSNAFGDAFGIFNGHVKNAFISAKWAPKPAHVPFYSGKDLIVDGTWKRLANREDVLAMFPSSPPIYHEHDEEDPESGKFGCAETEDGEVRNLTRAQAKALGLLDDKYYQFVPCNSVAQYLEIWLG